MEFEGIVLTRGIGQEDARADITKITVSRQR